jgi:hypothetical protein
MRLAFEAAFQVNFRRLKITSATFWNTTSLTNMGLLCLSCSNRNL